ncbi:integrase core domain-containing protein [Enterococcus hirae]
MLNRRSFYSGEEVRLACFSYIKGFYNTKRPHETLGMLTPNEKETRYFEYLLFLCLFYLHLSIYFTLSLKFIIFE